MEPLDPDFHNAFVDALLGAIGRGVLVGKLKNVGFQTVILRDNVGDGAEVYHSLAQQELQPEEGFRANDSRSDDLIREHWFGQPLHRPKWAQTSLWIRPPDHLGNS
jgi:hypothetical protein